MGWDAEGVCTCSVGWVLADCSAWANGCDVVCDTCIGPDADDCVACIEHAERTHDGDDSMDIGEC
jgi:hypothetical protein